MSNIVKPLLPITVFMDYVCPFCYIGERRLARLSESHDLRINWCLLELHPETPLQGRPTAQLGYLGEQMRILLADLDRLNKEEGIAVRDADITPNSHRALLLAEAAKEGSRETFEKLHHALFAAHFVEGRNLGDTEVLRSIALNAGLRDETIERAWKEERYRYKLKQNKANAALLNIPGTPTFLIGQWMISGAVSGDELLEVASQLKWM
ncbi:MAG: DsbA family oxidoreductase [Burkholderiales bacterium]